MSARLRRLAADYEKIKTEAAGHKFINVEALGAYPPEKYLVTYRLKGLKLDEKLGRPVNIDFHQVEIYLSESYPREKPLCQIKTEIFHPNFKSRGQVCIGDHWAAGESLWDVIVHIGEMIQYRSYNPKSPLDAQAANWARQNEQFFPIGQIDLYQAEPEIEIAEISSQENQDDNLDIVFSSQDKLDDIDIIFD